MQRIISKRIWFACQFCHEERVFGLNNSDVPQEECVPENLEPTLNCAGTCKEPTPHYFFNVENIFAQPLTINTRQSIVNQ